jgi:DNA-binding CsgD family transcriptional regulator
VCVDQFASSQQFESPSWRLSAFGISAFLTDRCVEAQIADPVPYFGFDLLEGVRRNMATSGLLSSHDIARANAGEGCNLFPFVWLQRPNDFSTPAGAQLIARGMHLLLDDHKGYNLKRMIKEGSREQEQAFLKGGMKRLKSCWVEKGAEREERILFGLTRDEARQDAFGTGISLLFSHTRPRCGFTRKDQQVLQCAIDDLADDEIAGQLNITAHGVNMRWRAIYARVQQDSDIAALVFGNGWNPAEENSCADAPSTPKRRRVVAYVRSHPEELRPYAWG